MFIFNYFIGFLEDNVGYFVIPRLLKGFSDCTQYIGYPTGLCQNLYINNQPLFFIPAYLLIKIVDPILSYNILVMGGLALTLLFAVKFLKKIFGAFLAIILSIIFISSPYFAYQSWVHPDLIQFWPVIWFFDTLIFYKGSHRYEYLGLLLALTVGISNYFGYFTIILTLIYLASSFPYKSVSKQEVTERIKGFIITSSIFLLSTLIFLTPYVKANYLSPKVIGQNDGKVVNRPYEDFVIFSSRPWYYLLPSVDNPFFGNFSKKTLDQLAQSGSYLTQNYFKSEHSASYLGWFNIVFAVIGFAKIRKKKVPINHIALFATILGLAIFSMPPQITVSGHTVYMPSYLLFKLFPMFRVLARSGIFILFLTLIFTGYGYKTIFDNRKRAVVAMFGLFSLMEFFIPIKITHADTPPKVFTYIKMAPQQNAPLVVYPYESTNTAFFWLNTYHKPLINPKSYKDSETGFSSDDFTKKLITSIGLEKAKALGAQYLVYFNVADNNDGLNFFNESPLLSKIDAFLETDPDEKTIGKFVRIIEVGTNKSNSAILYVFK